MQIYISWADIASDARVILPIFLPFSGCPVRCIFCAQHLQTGAGGRTFRQALENLEHQLQTRAAEASPVDLGFFGGTFTALAPDRFAACLALVRRHRNAGRIRAARCSTRPDAVDAARLAMLAEAGFEMVELGIQSYDAGALAAARRGYDGDIAAEACAAVRASGLRLGVQLLPGMPGVTPEIFQRDVRMALDCGAQALRFYPCLVINGTQLAALWRRGDFAPWSLEATIPALAEGWLTARHAGVPVIRMGLAQEPGLDAQILAGPAHPALGSMVQGEALWRTVSDALRERPKGAVLRGLRAPRNCRGFFWGHRGALRTRWGELGLGTADVQWHDAPEIVVETYCAL